MKSETGPVKFCEQWNTRRYETWSCLTLVMTIVFSLRLGSSIFGLWHESIESVDPESSGCSWIKLGLRGCDLLEMTNWILPWAAYNSEEGWCKPLPSINLWYRSSNCDMSHWTAVREWYRVIIEGHRRSHALRTYLLTRERKHPLNMIWMPESGLAAILFLIVHIRLIQLVRRSMTS